MAEEPGEVVTPADQIRAKLGAIARRELDERSLTPGEAQDILDRLDALEAEHADAKEAFANAHWTQKEQERLYEELKAEHADRVWLTRDEAKLLRRRLGAANLQRFSGSAEDYDLATLLDERIGEKA